MQSYYVDQWQQQGILLEATFTPLSFGAQWLPGVGEAFADRVANFGQHRLDRRPPARPLRGPRRPRARGLAAALLPSSATRRRGRSSSESPARRRSTSPPARPRSTRTSAHCSVIPRGQAGRVRVDGAEARRPAARGVPPDVDGADGRRRRRQRHRPRRRRPGHRGPVRRRREPAAVLGRRQPDDDDHRLRLAASPAGSPSQPPSGLAPSSCIPSQPPTTIPAVASSPR